MKRTSIKAGIVYASKSDHGSPSPVMFLEDGAAGIYSRQRGGSIRQQTETSYTKAHRGRGWSDESIGYAAVVQDWITPGTKPALLPWALDPAAELERFRAGGKPSVPGLKFDIITSLGKIGPWGAAVAEHEARLAAKREAEQKAEAGRVRAKAAHDGLRALGISARLSFSTHRIELDIWEAEKLLDMLREQEG